MTNNKSSIKQLKEFLKEMFQFNNNDLDFGIYRIYNLKRKEIENFIDGTEEQCLEPIINKTLQLVSNIEREVELTSLTAYLKKFNQESLVNDPAGNFKEIQTLIDFSKDDTEKENLSAALTASTKEFNITDEIKDKIYNHILGYFEMYYSNGDFGYNNRSRSLYKVPYEADYYGNDTMFHWKHKGSLYIKTGNSFNAIKFKLKHLNKEFELRLETNDESKEEEVARNNNKDTKLKHYKFNRFEEKDGVTRIVFNFSDSSTTKVKLFEDLFKEVLKSKEDISKYLSSEGKDVFNNLEEDYDKIQEGSIKGIGALRVNRQTLLNKVNKNFERGSKIELLNKGKPIERFSDETLETIYNIDQKLNSFYIGNDSDYFIHENLQEFLTQEKERYIKNHILNDLKSILDGKLDNTTLIIAKAFELVGRRIIEFLSAIEEFQKKLFTLKKKVVESEYCLTIDNIDEKYYKEILENKEQLAEWGFLFSVIIKNLDDLKAQPTLVLDTKFFKRKDGSNPFKDKILAEIENLDERTNGLLINSENYQALTFLQEKYYKSISGIYIDPPYNTGDDGFMYKDNFKSSSWLSMIDNRLGLGISMLNENGVLFSSIGDEEQEHLATLIRQKYGKENLIGTLIWEKKKKGTFLSGNIAKMKDYIHCLTKDNHKFNGLIGEIAKETTTYPCVNASNSRDVRIIPLGIESKFREHNYQLKKGEVISAGNMNLVLLSDLVIENGILAKELIIEGNWRYTQDNMKDFADKKELYITQDLYLRRIVDEPRYKRMKDLLLRVGEDKEGDFRNYNIDNLNESGWGTNEDANEELHNLLGEQYAASYPKPSKLISLLLASTRINHGYFFDYFAGSGTTGHSIISLNKKDKGSRKYMLVEMGSYFEKVTKTRIQRTIYTENWKMGKPQDNIGSFKHFFKYIVLEQYEDVLDAIEQFEGETPKNLPLKYLYNPELNNINSTLDLSTPFSNKIKYGQPTKEGFVDLVDTYNYLQGYELKSIKVFTIRKKYYKVVETTDTLVIWRDIDLGKDDSKAIIEIAEKYPEATQIEVNYDFNILAMLKDKQLQVGKRLLGLTVIHKDIFNQ